VVGVDRLTQLIQQAVRTTLKRRLSDFELGLEPADIAAATKDEFLRLLEDRDSLARDREQLRAAHDDVVRQKTDLAGTVDDLRRQLEKEREAWRCQQQILEREAVVQGGAAEQLLGTELRELFDTTPDPKELRERVIAAALAAVHVERRRAVDAEMGEHRNRVELLERRIQKLAATLQQNERELLRAGQAASIDPGISSLFRSVQGVTGVDSEAQRKRELMAAIFEQNLALRGNARVGS
jgi:hypothetical protein